jgi:hypothetical protein
MSDFRAIANRVEIEALRDDCTDATTTRDYVETTSLGGEGPPRRREVRLPMTATTADTHGDGTADRAALRIAEPGSADEVM